MKGKIGLVVGLGVGYVLGTRAGRERYEQIRTQWLKVWNTDPVQDQVEKVKDFVGDKAAAVPGAVWTGAVKIVKSVTGNGTPGQKLDAVIASGKEAAEEVSEAAEDAVDEVKERAAAADKPAAKKPATKPAAQKSGD
ncbi:MULTISPECIES: hypothetical protein [Microbacterium]|uniref:YtxH domain-containing protein n=1 Tax=Microbacterium sufflavum TaxID=2851649 RepID=A0ABY4IEX0_9MICO|nr:MULTISPECIES: hypothetical protein [Microbacterium]MBN6191835.1 hypothetical protein [Aneurinibacillus sp. BA2021]MCK2025339.1 hypothetical protein [Microbacterium sufflavum]MPS76112.1 hypothetical protein [Microbacterium sp.]UPL10220.1 hypothetical protein KV394_03465 [Microbacterium sufflavum]